MASPNPSCPSFFSRPSSSARFRGNSLLAGLRDLHHRLGTASDGAGCPTGSSDSSSSSRPNSRPTSAYSHATSIYSAYSYLSNANSVASSASTPGSGREPTGPRARASHDTGVGVDFLEEVQRHVFSPDTSVAQMTDMLLAPAAKQAGASSFLAIPRLVHARFVGPPNYVVAYAPTISVHALVSLLKEHSQQQCQAGAPAPRYWLDCFTGMHHSTEGQLSAQRQAQRLEGAREAAAHGAKGALLLLDNPCAALQQAWTLQDILWVVKEHGPQALHVLPYGGATCESLQDTLKHASCSLDMAQCSFPGNAAQQWQEGQKLAKGLEAHRISMETFTLWIRGALADVLQRWGADTGALQLEDSGEDDHVYDCDQAGNSEVFLSERMD